jgi:glycosyltransferase involved in cell wall biosynthesis
VRGIRAFNGLLEAFRREVQQELAAAPQTVVHAHWWVPAGMALPAGVPSVITCHGTDVRLLDGALPFRLLGRKVLQRARLVTAVSSALAEVIRLRAGITIPDDQVQAMPLLEIARPPSTGGGGMIVVGRLTDQKRVELVIEAAALLRESGTPLPLRIVGDGPARARLEALVVARGMNDIVDFVGAVPPDAIPGFLATADVMVMPAHREGMGLAAAEALIQGVPVVACRDGGGLLDVVPESGAGRIVVADPRAIADAVTSLKNDPDGQDAAWIAGRAWQHRLSPEHVADCCMSWYERVLAA